MHDESHLDDFLDQQTDPISIALVRCFLAAWRDPDVGSNEYSPRVREAMEQLLDNAHATAESVRR